jgi:hypothetical protein
MKEHISQIIWNLAEDLGKNLEEDEKSSKTCDKHIEAIMAKIRQHWKSDATIELFINECVKDIPVYLAIISHKHGQNTYCNTSFKKIQHSVAEYCRDYWRELIAYDPSIRKTPPEDDAVCIEQYFETHPDEYFITEEGGIQRINNSINWEQIDKNEERADQEKTKDISI